ncbi:MAG TPA: N-acetylmuramoyl-L-alanine amidase [Limnochordales bacterium]
MARVTNARSGLRMQSVPVSVVEVESTEPPTRWELVGDTDGDGCRWTLRLHGLALNMEPFAAPVLDGVVRSFELAQPQEDLVECRIRLEWDQPPAGPPEVTARGLPVVTRLCFGRDRLREKLGAWRVVVDPGHGGKDRGARGPVNLEERHVTLQLAHRLAWHLEEGGCAVWCTRVDDRMVPLAQRLALAASVGADVLVSLHTGHGTDPGEGGACTRYGQAGGWIPARHDPRALALAVHQALLERLGVRDRGVVELPWVAEEPGQAGRPALGQVGERAGFAWVWVEPVCLANPYEEAFLRSCTFRDRIAQGIRNGLARAAAAGERGGGGAMAAGAARQYTCD